jgi:putative acetyltransferase
VAEIGMSVHGDWRRQGVATALLEHSESWARSTGKIRKLSLNVFEKNVAAIRLYQKLGYVFEGRLVNQINLDGAFQDLLLMTKHL